MADKKRAGELARGKRKHASKLGDREGKPQGFKKELHCLKFKKVVEKIGDGWKDLNQFNQAFKSEIAEPRQKYALARMRRALLRLV